MKFIFSIKSKLILAISALMAVIFVMIAFLFVNEKKVELADDVYVGVRSYAELTASHIISNVDLYLKEEGFVYFNRDIRDLIEQNRDVSWIRVISYDGQIIYDSMVDVSKKYDGEPRVLNRDIDKVLLRQVKSKNPSFAQGISSVEASALESQVYYLKKGASSRYEFIDFNEKSKVEPTTGFKFSYFVQPASEKYSVVYGVTYANMDARIADMIERIVYTAVFGFMLGIVLSILMSLQVTKPVLKLVFGASEVAKGNLKVRVDIRTRDEIGYLGETFNKMTEDLEKSLEARVYKERVGKELELARDIQDEIIPKKIPEVAGLDVACGLIPATEVGGDMYDIIPMDVSKTLFYLGDVTGHGVPASMIGAIANALFYSFSPLKDLKDILANVNRIIKKKKTATMFMTLALMKWDSFASVLSYINAGHEPLYHYVAKRGEIVESQKGGLAIGMVEDISGVTAEHNFALSSGDFVVIYSDGVIEAWKNDTEVYGAERFKMLLNKCGALESASAIRDAIFEDLKVFCNGYEQKDDITVMVMRKK